MWKPYGVNLKREGCKHNFICAYEKAGFKAVKQETDLSVVWMIKERNDA